MIIHGNRDHSIESAHVPFLLMSRNVSKTTTQVIYTLQEVVKNHTSTYHCVIFHLIDRCYDILSYETIQDIIRHT